MDVRVIDAQPQQPIRALLVDADSISRAQLSRLMEGFGIRQVVHANGPDSALSAIRSAPWPFDVIVTEYSFAQRHEAAMSGHELVQELRRTKALTASTAVIMVTQEARYAQVAGSVEGLLDDYLLKPLSAAIFQRRLAAVLARKAALRSVFENVKSGRIREAATLCEQMQRTRSPQASYAARLGSELLLKLQDFEAAHRMLETEVAYSDSPWAKLEMAQLLQETTGTPQALRALEVLVEELPGFAEAHDALGRLYQEDAKYDLALNAYLRSVEVTPSNVRRLQKCGTLAFKLGQLSLAKSMLDTAVNLGQASGLVEPNSLVCLALVNHDLDEFKACDRALRCLTEAVSKQPFNFRLSAMLRCVQAVETAQRNQHRDGLSSLSKLTAELNHEDFDFDLGCTVLHLTTRLLPPESRDANAEKWVRRVCERFGTSRVSCHFLESALNSHPGLRQAAVAAMSELSSATYAAMDHAVDKDFDQAATELLELAQKSLNARVFSLASAFLDKHKDGISEDLALNCRLALSSLEGIYGKRALRSQPELRLLAA